MSRNKDGRWASVSFHVLSRRPPRRPNRQCETRALGCRTLFRDHDDSPSRGGLTTFPPFDAFVVDSGKGKRHRVPRSFDTDVEHVTILFGRRFARNRRRFGGHDQARRLIHLNSRRLGHDTPDPGVRRRGRGSLEERSFPYRNSLKYYPAHSSDDGFQRRLYEIHT